MKKRLSEFFVFLLTALSLFLSIPGWGETPESQVTSTLKEVQKLDQEIQNLQEKIQHLDKHLIHRPETREAAQPFDGMEIGLGLTGILQGPSNADDLSGENQTDASGSLDMEIQSRIGDHGTLFLLVESRQGQGLNDEIETLHGVNADAVEDQAEFKLTEAWYEQSFLEERLLLALGKVDLTNYFDTNIAANDETLQFLADGFVNNIAVEFPKGNGPGLRLVYSPNYRFEIGFGLGESDADLEEVNQGAFGILELIYKSKFQNLQGDYRLYAWANRSEHVEWNDLLNDHEENRGIGVSLDQAFNEQLIGFLRAGIQDESVN